MSSAELADIRDLRGNEILPTLVMIAQVPGDWAEVDVDGFVDQCLTELLIVDPLGAVQRYNELVLVVGSGDVDPADYGGVFAWAETWEP